MSKSVSAHKQAKYKAHPEKLKRKKHEQEIKARDRKEQWNSDPEWQRKKPALMKRLKEAARKRRRERKAKEGN